MKKMWLSKKLEMHRKKIFAAKDKVNHLMPYDSFFFEKKKG